MMQMVHSRFNALLSACVLSLIATAGWSQSLTWLGTLPNGGRSEAYGVSGDGRVVVGMAYNARGWERAFRWTASDGMQHLGTLGGDGSEASGVSADGRVVVGRAVSAVGQSRAFRWENGVMQDLGALGGSQSWAYAVSADGRVVVGSAQNVAGQWRAFRWTASGGMQDLGTRLSRDGNYAFDVSADGAVVVVWSYNAAGERRAFRWQNGVLQDLGTLGGTESVPHGVSADGSVVVGWAHNTAGQQRAFRWTASSGRMQDLGTLSGGNQSLAYDVSGDGRVVVGRATNAEGSYRAFRWTASRGMEDLNTTYASLLTDGSMLWEARAISSNGRYIVGQGYNMATNRTEAFLLDTGGRPPCTLDGDVNGDGIVDDADLLILLFNFGNRCP